MISFGRTFAFATLVIADVGNTRSEVVSDDMCAEPGSCQEKHVLMQQTKLRSLNVDADAQLTTANAVKQGKSKVFDFGMVDVSVFPTEGIPPLDWEEPYRIAYGEQALEELNEQFTSAASFSFLDGVASKVEDLKAYGSLSKQKNWAAKQILKFEHSICDLHSIADVDWSSPLQWGGSTMGGYIGFVYGLQQKNASVVQHRKYGAPSQDSPIFQQNMQQMNTSNVPSYCRSPELYAHANNADACDAWMTKELGPFPWTGEHGVQCGDAGRLPHLDHNCNMMVHAWCTSSADACARRVVEVAVNWGSVAAFMIPQAQALSKAANAAKMAKAATGTTRAAVLTGLRTAIKETVELVKKKVIAKFKKYMVKKAIEQGDMLEQRAAASLTEQQMNEIIDGGLEILSAMAVSAAPDGVGDLALEILEAVEPTGLVSAIRGMTAGQDCKDLQLDDMPMDGIPGGKSPSGRMGDPELLAVPDPVAYRGFQDRTESGLTCQAWTDQYPHKHSYTPKNHPHAGLGAHNYCRLPQASHDGGERRIWCYTQDENTRYEYCNKRSQCDERLLGEKHVDYRGCQTQTRQRKTCQRWDAQLPHAHSKTPTNYMIKGLGKHNYCRNPDGEDTIWCYTTSSTRWEYCDPL